MSTHLRKLRGQIDPVLTNLAVGYKNAEFIAEKIFPQVLTDAEGVQVPVFGKGSFVEYDTKRAVGAASNVITLDSPNFLPLVLEETIWRPVWTTASKRNRCLTSKQKPHAALPRVCSCAKKSKPLLCCRRNRPINPAIPRI